VFEVDIDGRSVLDNAKTDAVANYNRTTVSDKGILTVSKSANATSAAAGEQVTYTISGSNVGNASVYGELWSSDGSNGGIQLDLDVPANGAENRSGVLITDILPTELNPATLVTIASGSFSPANATPLYRNADNNRWQAAKPANIDGVGLFIPDATSANLTREVALAPGQGYSLTFSLQLDSDATEGVITNNARTYYNDGTQNWSPASNDSLITIGGAGAVDPGVALGPSGQPELGNDNDGQTETTTNADYTTLTGTVADAGEVIIFTQTVKNTGNTTDVADITLIANGVPGGTISFLKLDGVTPLADTDLDGKPDVGPLAPGDSGSFKVAVRIPASANASAGPHDIRLRATTTVVDSANAVDTNDTYIRIGEIRPAGVDIATDGESSDGVAGDDTPATATGWTPGAVKDFVLDVANIRTNGTTTGAVDTYTLSLTGVPAGWVALVYIDSNVNGTLDNDELVPVTNTQDLDPSEIEQIIVRVFVPEDATSGAHSFTVTATSTNNTSINDAVTLSFNVLLVPAVQIVPDNSGVAVRGGTMTYRHVVTNIGNSTEDFQLSASSVQGWSFVFVDAAGTTLGASPLLSTGYGNATLSPGESQEVYIKVFVPANAPVGITDILTVTVTGVTNTTATDSSVDSTTVIDGNLQLVKSVDVATAKPTRTTATLAADIHPVYYTCTYQNLGAASVTNVEVIDAIPANTRLVLNDGSLIGTQAGPSGTFPAADFTTGTALAATDIKVSTDNGATYVTLTAYGTGPIQADNSAPAVTHIKYVIGTVAAGQKGQVRFQVLID
jgi:uncharacterized membrane protein